MTDRAPFSCGRRAPLVTRSISVKDTNRGRSAGALASGRFGTAMGAATSRLAGSSVFYLLCALILMCAVFGSLKTRSFLSAFNIVTVLSDSSVLMIMAVGQMFVITTAGIDLSVGGVLVFSGVVANMAMVALGGKGFATIFIGFLISVSLGLAWGWLNGFLTAKVRIPSLITTLGTSGMSLGFALLMTNGSDLGGIPTELPTYLGVGKFLGVIPWLVIIAVGVVVAASIVLRLTRFGLYTIAIGANPEAARRSGISVDRELIKVYAICGGLAGLAGYLNLARFSSTTIAGHGSDNLQTIAAVVLGGTSLMGGIASIMGTVIGVFIPIVLQNGLIMLDVRPFWQQVLIGAILIIAVYSDQLKRRGEIPLKEKSTQGE